METLTEIIYREQRHFTSYQTYEELLEYNRELPDKYPSLTRVEFLGFSSDKSAEYPDGRPIEAVIISDPAKEKQRPYALMQMEHENELIPTLALQLTAEVLCSHPELLDELGYNVIMLNTTHPDGIALQSWATNGQDFTPLNYILYFYRSCPLMQVAWGYPLKYKKANFQKPVSETKASMKIMKRYKPRVLHSAHAAPIDNVHFLLTHPNKSLVKQLEDAVRDNKLSLRHGEADGQYVSQVEGHPGFYHPVYTARAAYDYREKHLPKGEMRWSSGATSTEYLSKVLKSSGGGKPFALLSEVPYMTTDALVDHNLTDITHRDAERMSIDQRRRILGRIVHYFDLLEKLANNHNSSAVGRLARSVEWYCKDHAPARLMTEEKALQASAFGRLATRAEAYTRTQLAEFATLLFWGEAHHLAVHLDQPGIAEEMRGEIEPTFNSINEVSPLRTLPLSATVGVQALGGLIATRQSSRALQEMQK